jgi:homeobox-leucine zipper protein
MSQRRWSETFGCIITKATILEEVSTGVAGGRNGVLQLVSAKQSTGSTLRTYELLLNTLL